MKRGKKIPLALFGLATVTFLAIQLVPVERTNPPVTADIAAPKAVKSILRESCYDCHSNETVWPWYSRIAPVSWLVTRDVSKGRQHLNFSNWEGQSPNDKVEAAEEILEEISEGKMPMPIYVAMHSSARLTPEKSATLAAWIESFGVQRGSGAQAAQSNHEEQDDHE